LKMRAANTQDTGPQSIPADGILRLLVKKIIVTPDQKTVADLDRWASGRGAASSRGSWANSIQPRRSRWLKSGSAT